MRVLSCALLAALFLLARADAGFGQGSQVGYLVQQDLSDCQNGNVREGNPSNMGGVVVVNRGSDGKSMVKVEITAVPNTTYHFFLKCVRHLGDFKTDDEGIGNASFDFQAGESGNTFAFDSYPEGAPAGNKFQSTQFKF